MSDLLAHAGEPGAELPGVWVVELVEDGQGVLPGFAGGLGVTGSVPGVTELDEGVGLGGWVSCRLVEVEGPPGVPERAGIPVLALERHRERVVDPGLPGLVAELTKQPHCLP
jgi:hypothetical protein